MGLATAEGLEGGTGGGMGKSGGMGCVISGSKDVGLLGDGMRGGFSTATFFNLLGTTDSPTESHHQACNVLTVLLNVQAPA